MSKVILQTEHWRISDWGEERLTKYKGVVRFVLQRRSRVGSDWGNLKTKLVNDDLQELLSELSAALAKPLANNLYLGVYTPTGTVHRRPGWLARLSPAERTAVAQQAGLARWNKMTPGQQAAHIARLTEGRRRAHQARLGNQLP